MRASRLANGVIVVVVSVDLAVSIYAATHGAWTVSATGLVLATTAAFALRWRLKRTKITTVIGELQVDYDIEDHATSAGHPPHAPPAD